MARSFARRSELPENWAHVWLDRSWLHRTLGVDARNAPYVFAIDTRGRVVGATRGAFNSGRAQLIWTAVSTVRR
jgi:hypothetical protein